jgi:hypothetical protein
MVSGEGAFAKSYLLSQQLDDRATVTTLYTESEHSAGGNTLTLTASVERLNISHKGTPTGRIQFALNGRKASALINLTREGTATWKMET